MPDALTPAPEHEAQHRFNGLFDRVPIGLYRTTPAGDILDVNQALVDMFGYASAEELKKNTVLAEYTDPQDRQRWLDVMSRDGIVRDFEIRMRRADGTVVWIQDSGRAVRDVEGNVIYYDGSMTDISERKRAEEALRHSEALYRTTIDSISDAVHVVDEDLRFTLVNASLADWCERLGIGRDFVGKHLLEVFPFLPSEVLDQYAQALATGVPCMTEEESELNGQIIATETAKIPLLVPGLPSAILTVMRDITARKRNEAALRESEELHRTLVNSVVAAIATIDVNGRYRFLNGVAAARLGGVPENYIGRSMMEIFPPSVATRQVASIQRVIRTGKAETIDSTTVLQGKPRAYNTTVSPVRGRDGTIESALIVGRDVTEKRNAEENLRTALDRLQEFESMVNRGPGVVCRWSLDAGRTVEFVSENVKQFGYAPEEFTAGRITWQEITHADDTENLARTITDGLDNGEHEFHLEYRIVTRDGELRWLSDHSLVIRAEDGKPTHIEGLLLDTTDRREMEEALKSSHAQLRSLTARSETVRERERRRIAHQIHDELGHELTALKMDVSWLARALGKPNVPEQLEVLQGRSKAIAASLGQTIQTVRQIATHLRPPILDFGLGEAIEWQAQVFEERTRIRFEVQAQTDLQDLDEERSTALFRIFQELLTNVARHSGATHVAVDLTQMDDSVQLSVVDNGKGMPCGASSLTRGLGLAGIRERLQLFNGTFRVENGADGGAGVYVSLPIAANTREPE